MPPALRRFSYCSLYQPHIAIAFVRFICTSMLCSLRCKCHSRIYTFSKYNQKHFSKRHKNNVIIIYSFFMQCNSFQCVKKKKKIENLLYLQKQSDILYYVVKFSIHNCTNKQHTHTHCNSRTHKLCAITVKKKTHTYFYILDFPFAFDLCFLYDISISL